MRQDLPSKLQDFGRSIAGNLWSCVVVQEDSGSRILFIPLDRYFGLQLLQLLTIQGSSYGGIGWQELPVKHSLTVSPTRQHHLPTTADHFVIRFARGTLVNPLTFPMNIHPYNPFFITGDQRA